MGAFSNVDYELQNNEAAVSNAFMEDDDMDMPQTVPAEPATGSFPPDTELAPATAVSEPSAVSAVRTKRLKPSARQNGTPGRQKSSGRNRLHWKSWMP